MRDRNQPETNQESVEDTVERYVGILLLAIVVSALASWALRILAEM